MKYPSLSPRSGTVLEVRDVPKSIIRPDEFPEGAIEILENAKSADLQALKSEATALRKRLAEIMDILAENGETL